MSDIAIEVKNLSKIYKLYKQPSDLLFEFLTGKNKHSEVHALKNINFEIFFITSRLKISKDVTKNQLDQYFDDYQLFCTDNKVKQARSASLKFILFI